MSDEPLWRRDEQRWATERRRFLERAAGLNEPVAHAVAWGELGYSVAGVAKKIGRSPGTVENYLDAVADEFGVLAACASSSSKLDVRGPLGDADLGREVTA